MGQIKFSGQNSSGTSLIELDDIQIPAENIIFCETNSEAVCFDYTYIADVAVIQVSSFKASNATEKFAAFVRGYCLPRV